MVLVVTKCTCSYGQLLLVKSLECNWNQIKRSSQRARPWINLMFYLGNNGEAVEVDNWGGTGSYMGQPYTDRCWSLQTKVWDPGVEVNIGLKVALKGVTGGVPDVDPAPPLTRAGSICGGREGGPAARITSAIGEGVACRHSPLSPRVAHILRPVERYTRPAVPGHLLWHFFGQTLSKAISQTIPSVLFSPNMLFYSTEHFPSTVPGQLYHEGVEPSWVIPTLMIW